MFEVNQIVFLSHYTSFNVSSIDEARKTRDLVYNHLGFHYKKNVSGEYYRKIFVFYFSADKRSLENVKIYSPYGIIFEVPKSIEATTGGLLEYVFQMVRGVNDPLIVIFSDQIQIANLVGAIISVDELERVGYLPGPATGMEAYICKISDTGWKIKFCTKEVISDENPVPNLPNH